MEVIVLFENGVDVDDTILLGVVEFSQFGAAIDKIRDKINSVGVKVVSVNYDQLLETLSFTLQQKSNKSVYMLRAIKKTINVI